MAQVLFGKSYKINMFTRKNATYLINDEQIDMILKDPANPLTVISGLIPQNATILDIGSGSGTLARVLNKTGKKIFIDAIDNNEQAAFLCKNIYRTFFNSSVEDILNTLDFNQYDYIILADVLEHMSLPDIFLENLKKKLSPHTKIIVSLPNIAFGIIRLALLNGIFQYKDSGILEKTHLRFFTYQSCIQLFSNSKFKIASTYYLERDILYTEIDDTQKFINPILFYFILKKSYSNVYQFLFVLTSSFESDTKVCIGTNSHFLDIILYNLRILKKRLFQNEKA